QKMAAGKNQNVPVDGAQATYHPVGPGANLIRRFSAGATVAEQLPTGTIRKDLGRATAFILAVVPFVQVTIDFSHGPKPANSQVRLARCNALVNTLVKVSPFNRSPRRRALRSPRSVSGKSVIPVCWPERLQAVSPCRAT